MTSDGLSEQPQSGEAELLLSRGCEDPQDKEVELLLSEAVTKCGVRNRPNLSGPLFSSPS